MNAVSRLVIAIIVVIIIIAATIAVYVTFYLYKPAPATVSVILDSNAEYYAPFFLALDKGYFSSQGLNVIYNIGSGSANTISQLAAGVAPMAFTDAMTGILAIGKNNASIVAVASILPLIGLAIIFLTKSGITKPKDLEGKKVGMAPGSASYQLFPLYCKLAGINYSRVKIVTMSLNALPTALISGQVDAVSLVIGGIGSAAIASARQAGLNASYFLYSDVGITAPGYVLWVRSDFLNAHKDIVAKFVTALLMGIRDTLINPNDAAVAYARHIAGVDLNIVKAAVNDYVNLVKNALIKAPIQNKLLGYIVPEYWMNAWSYVVNYLGGKYVSNINAYYTNDFVTAANIVLPS